jgi:hypothetical protein
MSFATVSPLFPAPTSFFMSQQHRTKTKRARRQRYLKRKKETARSAARK